MPVAGARKFHQLEETIAAANVEPTPTDVAAFAEALAAIDINGERYPANLMATTGL